MRWLFSFCFSFTELQLETVCKAFHITYYWRNFNTYQMPIITINYIAKWQLKSAPNYWFTKCQKCYNAKSGKFINQILKGSTIGYIINGKFVSINNIKKDLELIQKQTTPF